MNEVIIFVNNGGAMVSDCFSYFFRVHFYILVIIIFVGNGEEEVVFIIQFHVKHTK